MTVDWGTWAPLNGAPAERAHKSDKAAQRYFEQFVAAREKRKSELRALLERNGVQISTDDSGIQRLHDWFRDSVAADADNPRRPAEPVLGVAIDVGIYLGEAIIERAPHLRWTLVTASPEDVSYHCPVLSGFTKVPNRDYHVDPVNLVRTHAYGLVAGRKLPRTLFVDIVKTSTSRA